MAITLTAMNKLYKDGIRIKEIIFDWVTPATSSTATCAIGYELWNAHLQSASVISGRLISLETMPGLLGVVDLTLSTTPMNNYDVYLYDSYSCDMLSANAENRASAVAQVVAYSTPLFVDTELTLTVTNTGTGKVGRVKLFVEE